MEIEAKMRLDDAAALLARLKEAGATSVGGVLETNTIFDTEDRTLLAADKALRVRSARDLESAAVHCTMTYKGPAQSGQVKSRDEIETSVGDADAAGRLLERLGFVRVFRFEKRRQSW